MNDLLGTWIDGARRDTLPADDRGLHYGDGLFETILVRDGCPRFLDAHLARLALGCERLAIPCHSLSILRADVTMACEQAPALAMLKLMVTRGSALRRGYAPDGGERPRRLVSLFASTPLQLATEGVDLVIASTRLGDNRQLAGIKHLNRLENVLAAREARSAQAFDALLLGTDQRLVGGAMGNVFLVRGGAVRTPRVDRAGVAGVTRSIVLRECAALGIACDEQDLSLSDLYAAEESFITNSRIGVVPVRSVGQHRFLMNPITRRLAKQIEALDA